MYVCMYVSFSLSLSHSTPSISSGSDSAHQHTTVLILHSVPMRILKLNCQL